MNDPTPQDDMPSGIPQEIVPYPINYPVSSSYNILSFSNRGKASLDPYELMRYMEDNWIVFQGTCAYQFNGYVYVQISEEGIEQLLYRAVNDATSRFSGNDKPLLKDSMLKDLLKQYRNTHGVEDIPLPPDDQDIGVYSSEMGLIAFKNGVLNMDTLELLPFTPYVFVSFQIHAMYNPNLKEHPVEQVYKNIIPDDATRETFYRIAGYTMYSEILKIPGIFILYGGGETGKTSLQMVLTTLMSEHSFSALSMTDMADKYAPAMLEGKRANFCGEADNRPSKETKIAGSMIKDISEGSKKVLIQRKYQNPQHIVPTAKLWFCTNCMPDFGDRSSGMLRRLYIFPCRVKQSWDDQIRDKLLDPTALTWFANRTFDAYLDFLADGCKAPMSEDMNEETAHFALQDPISEFLLEEFGQIKDRSRLASDIDGRSTVELYAKYEIYCRARYVHPLRHHDFLEYFRNELNLYSVGKPYRTPEGKSTSMSVFRLKSRSGEDNADRKA